MQGLKTAALGLVFWGVPAVVAAALSTTASPWAWACVLAPSGLLICVSVLATRWMWRDYLTPATTRPALAVVAAVTGLEPGAPGFDLVLSFAGPSGEGPRATVRTLRPVTDVTFLSKLQGTLVPVHVREGLQPYVVDWNHWHACGGLGGWMTPPPPLHEPPLSEPTPEADRRNGSHITRVGMLLRGAALILAFGVVALRITVPTISSSMSTVLDAATFVSVAMSLMLVTGALRKRLGDAPPTFFQRAEDMDAHGEARVLAVRHGCVATQRFVELRLGVRIAGGDEEQELLTQVFNVLPATVSLRDLRGTVVPVRFRSADPRSAVVDWEALEPALGKTPAVAPPGAPT